MTTSKVNIKQKVSLIALFLLGTSAVTEAQVTFPNVEKGIHFKSEDESTKIQLNFRSQNLFTYTPEQNGEDATTNILVRRSRLKLGGHIGDPKFAFKFEAGLSNRDIGARSDFAEVNYSSKVILDAVFKYKPNKKMEFWFGQTKLPGNRERVISSQKLQFVDRSLVNSRFNIDRDAGFQFSYKDGKEFKYRIALAATTGEGRNITVNSIGGLSYTGRVEFLPFGDFTNKGDYFSSDLAREEKPKVSVGVTYNLNEGATRDRGQLGSFIQDTSGLFGADLESVHADLMFKYQGWSVASEFATRSNTLDNAPAGELSKAFALGSGFTIQAGYLLKSNYEFAVRYTDIKAATDDLTSISDQTEYTFGLSKYIIGHTLKWQTDISVLEQAGKDPSLRYRFQVEFGI